jgi:hypothetical protein
MRSGGKAPHIHILDINHTWLSTSCFSDYSLGERAPSINWIEGWMNPRFHLDMVVAKKKFPTPARNIILIVQPVV